MKIFKKGLISIYLMLVIGIIILCFFFYRQKKPFPQECISSETFISDIYSGVDFITFREEFLWDWKMKTFNWDEDEELVDISEEAIQTVPTEQEIWEQFLAAFPNTNTYYLQYPMVKGEFCITSMGKVFSGYSVIELVKEISWSRYERFRAEELLFWKKRRYHGSTPWKWIILQEQQLRQMYVDSFFTVRLPMNRGILWY